VRGGGGGQASVEQREWDPWTLYCSSDESGNRGVSIALAMRMRPVESVLLER
jgi:hypothetical protein